MDGCPLRIRPRRRASRTRSPRAPPASASTARWVPSWLEDPFHRLAATKDVPSKMRTTNRCQTHVIDKHPRLIRQPTPSSSRSWLRCVARFHGAPHASATCSRSLQGVFSPAAVALEQPTSDAPVTHLSQPLACAKSRPRRLLDGTSRPPFQENGPRPRFPATLPREEPRPLSPLPREKETAAATRGAFHRSKTSDRDTLADALAGRRRSHGFATVIRPPMPFRPARSPALG